MEHILNTSPDNIVNIPHGGITTFWRMKPETCFVICT